MSTEAISQPKLEYSPQSINQQLASGMSRDDLAFEFGHKSFKSTDMYMRRHGYVWDAEIGLYMLAPVQPAPERPVSASVKKIRQILQYFEDGMDPKAIAKLLGFASHTGLAEFMKEKHYFWNSEIQNYELRGGEIPPDQPADDTDPDDDFVEKLARNRDKITEILAGDARPEPPRYFIPGTRMPKSIHMSSTLNELLKTFCDENGMNQREFFDIATIETLKKYGYAAEVKGVLS